MVTTTEPAGDALGALQAAADSLSPVLRTALQAHARNRRADITECNAVLSLLQYLECDAETHAAALWFDVAMADHSQWQAASGELPATLVRLVEGQLASERVTALHAEQRQGSEGLRRLLLAIIRDLRVVFVLLSRQLVRMRHADELPADQARELAQLTSDVHAPLANRLGIWQLKWELEDLTFRQLRPEQYKHVAHLLDERRSHREQFIARCIDQLDTALTEAGIEAEMLGRPKHLYSIWRKMQRKHLTFDELYDILAVRVLVNDVSQCYAALGVVHGLWPHLPHEFDDYIARPKANGYQSLHTAVVGPAERTLEVQIRTHQMHRTCELGVAAHWRYKEGGGADAAFEERIAWMRGVLESGVSGDGLFTDEPAELVDDRVYLLTPRGDVLDLPQGATVLDFAYRVHTDVGHKCRGAKVNGRIVALTHQPRSGDRVNIIAGKVAEPSRDWILPHNGYLNTSRARDKVRAWFRRGEREANLEAGRQALDREMKRLAVDNVNLDTLPALLDLTTREQLLEALALGEVSSAQLARVLRTPEPAPTPAPPETAPMPAKRSAQKAEGVTIAGMGNLLTTLARCCQPVPGDDVRGYITRGRGVSVHRADCASLANLEWRDPDRVIEVQWGESGSQPYAVDVGVRAYDRKYLQRDVVAVISGAGVSIAASASRSEPRKGQVAMDFTLRVKDFGQLSDLMARLAGVRNVVDVHRHRTDA